MNSIRITVFGMLLALALCGGCGERSDGGEGPVDGPREIRIAGPNHLATLFVEAMAAGDAGRVARLCDGELAEFYSSVARIGAINLEILDFLEKRYPDLDDTERRRLWLFAEAWKRPMTSFDRVELDGRLRSENGGDRVVYQLAHFNRHSRRVYPELVVEKRDDRWRVTSFGEETPRGVHLGAVRNQLSSLEENWRAGVAAVEREEPRTLERAIDVLTRAIGAAAEAGDAGPGAENGR